MNGVRPMVLAGFASLTLALSPGVRAQGQPSSAHPAGRAHREFATAVIGKNLPEARRHMSKALIESLPASGGLAKACADRIGEGEIAGIQTVSTHVDGDRATVSYRLAMTDGTSRFGKEQLVLEDGEWKLDVRRPDEKAGREPTPEGARR